ncbi:uncharacterized protein MYCFIDRAFT_202613 [Pseudocercospora fijiensis CIRAD86]|uniref:Uncharacterized protein n=1 Tax=Pseudocercospora fijiensis (strain CIRAD86) TaxID=383855 RepID=M3BBM7_PSEFD|nr:uncharacterized protein MYCFIDRAFT_202613 [Pseudocercospora fijiensis CIRAD86]EME86692.1 hypothetical protein MYCFIDRAFT_202613 [Pseudocercospora fijiensis CIRAD86]
MSKEDDIEKNLPESSRASLDDDGQSSSSTLLEKPSQNKTPEEAGIKLPAEDATADEVRAYLVDILTLSHGLQHAEARQIASAWLAGTGRELRKYPGKMYHEIFGAQAGWMLYKEIKIAVVKEGYEQNPARTWAGKLSLCSAIIGAMVAVTSLGVLLGPVMWAISIPLYFCGLVGLLCVLLETRRAPEDVAERELVEIWDSQREVGGQGSK